MSKELTVGAVQAVVPRSLRNSVTQELIDNTNSLIKDDVFREAYRDNVMGFAHVMREGKWKLTDYLSAVKYVSYKLMGCGNLEAYAKTFPDRYQKLVNKGTSNKDMHSYSSLYHKNKLVTTILEASLTPVHILNADIHQKAINHLAYLMVSAKSEKVQADSAASLLQHLKAPEKKIELDINVKQDKSVDDLRKATLELVKAQKELIAGGQVDAKHVAHSKVIESTLEDVDEADYRDIEE